MINFWQNLKKPIIGLAPMDGVTDHPMRQIQCLMAKPAVFYTEFINIEGFLRQPQKFAKKLFLKDTQRPIVIQLFGNNPDSFYQAIKEITTLGFDGFDINMGCPAREVINKGGGGALINNYQLSKQIINSSLKAIKDSGCNLPLSIKTRIAKNDQLTKDWFKFLAQFPLSEITVHGRKLSQGLSGQVDWHQISIAASILKPKGIICLGNGGVKTLGEALVKSKQYNLDGILIGQAALGNPWVFKKDYQPTKEERLELILKHIQIVDKFYAQKGFVTVLKHLGWYCKGFPGAKKLKVNLLKTRSYQEVLRIITGSIPAV